MKIIAFRPVKRCSLGGSDETKIIKNWRLPNHRHKGIKIPVKLFRRCVTLLQRSLNLLCSCIDSLNKKNSCVDHSWSCKSIQGEFKSLEGKNLHSFRNDSRVKMLHHSTNEGNIFLDSVDLMVWNLMFFWLFGLFIVLDRVISMLIANCKLMLFFRNCYCNQTKGCFVDWWTIFPSSQHGTRL